MLLKHSSFLRYWGIQFLGAFNDNLYKNGLILFLSFASLQLSQSTSSLYINLSAALFILPFFLFSAHAGYFADRIDPAILIRRIKLLELVIMLLAGFGFLFGQIWWLMLMLLLMGTQSSYFGPVKYSILPRMLEPKALLTANAWVEGGTFIAILAGMLIAGWLVEYSIRWLYGVILLCALLGYLLARGMPSLKFEHDAAQHRFHWGQAFKELWHIAHSRPGLPSALLAISWFWFLGASYLTQLPNFVRHELHGDSRDYLLFLAAFSLSVAFGAGLGVGLKRLFKRQFGVALGLLGMGLAGASWAWAHLHFGASIPGSLLGVVALGSSAGLYAVPLYTWIQLHSEDSVRSRVIAANNVLNAVFMVLSAVMAIVLLGSGWRIPHWFLLISGGNVLILLWLWRRAPVLLNHRS